MLLPVESVKVKVTMVPSGTGIAGAIVNGIGLHQDSVVVAFRVHANVAGIRRDLLHHATGGSRAAGGDELRRAFLLDESSFAEAMPHLVVSIRLTLCPLTREFELHRLQAA